LGSPVSYHHLQEENVMKKSNWRRWFACSAALLAAAALIGIGSLQAAPRRKAAPPPAQRAKVDPGISQAALAAELAMEGEKRHSPILLLAAAELLGNLKESPRKYSPTVSFLGTLPAGAGKQALKLDFHALIDRARELAKGDAKLAPLVEARAEQLSSRGLIEKQGANLKSVEIGKFTFKVIDADIIPPGKAVELRNVIFEGGQPGAIVVVGDGDGDLDLWVYDGDSEARLGEDTGPTSRCVVTWAQGSEGPVTIRIANAGKASEKFVVLANW